MGAYIYRQKRLHIHTFGAVPQRCKHIPGLEGHAGVHVRPGSGRVPPPNGPPSPSRSKCAPEAIGLRGFGRTPPVSLASPLKGRDLGFSPALQRSRWLHPTALFTVDVGHISPPQPRLNSPRPASRNSWGCSPPSQVWTQTPVAVLSPISKDPGSSAGSAYASPARKSVPG
ncbi:hypothetical protein P4O66_003372 [Electrophorus voltai]|uniref:Uncharacterized protein n=1 Tax=Electrophorus voltai TaxID=2609070 RepID=A0AAD8YP49_9TELE|nr:hypothetical protein P4O66_003372 [Electrophorus voltai]